MALTENEIEKIAKSIFDKLVEYQEKFEKQNNEFIVSDEFGNSSIVSEKEYLQFEISKLRDIEKQHVQNERFEKAEEIKNKIIKLKQKLYGI